MYKYKGLSKEQFILKAKSFGTFAQSKSEVLVQSAVEIRMLVWVWNWWNNMKRVREFHCNKSSDTFCYICGKYTTISDRRKITSQVRIQYKDYFKIEVQHQGKCWVPHIICNNCRLILNKWARKEAGRHFTFKSPMIWRDPVDHETNCYICSTNIYGYSKRNKDATAYATVDSVTVPVTRGKNVGKFPHNWIQLAVINAFSQIAHWFFPW